MLVKDVEMPSIQLKCGRDSVVVEDGKVDQLGDRIGRQLC